MPVSKEVYCSTVLIEIRVEKGVQNYFLNFLDFSDGDYLQAAIANRILKTPSLVLTNKMPENISELIYESINKKNGGVLIIDDAIEESSYMDEDEIVS